MLFSRAHNDGHRLKVGRERTNTQCISANSIGVRQHHFGWRHGRLALPCLRRIADRSHYVLARGDNPGDSLILRRLSEGTIR